MRAVVQRVKNASVSVENVIVGQIDEGCLVYLGIGQEDMEADLDWLVTKVINLRIFEDADGKMNKSVMDVGGGVLVISQFTLFGNLNKGFRPSFNGAAKPEVAETLYEKFIDKLKSQTSGPVETGKFRAMMNVKYINDGPVTLWIDSKNKDY